MSDKGSDVRRASGADNIVRVENLVKNYGEVRAVKGISFSVERGSLFAFLGLNGAGKSTTINILCTTLRKTSGKVEICGLDLDRKAAEIKQRIGIVFQQSVLDDRLSVRENLTSRAALYGITGREWKTRLGELTELFELGDFLKRPYGKLSGGQRRRADVARGLINRPELLFLDEPTTGLDPQTRRRVWDVVHFIRERTGMTVFLTTHYMAEANDADTVVIMDSGEIVARGTPNGLKNDYSADYIKLYLPESAETEELLMREGRKFSREGDCYKISATGTAEARDFILAHPDIASDFEVVKGDMDDVFLNVTGHSLTEGGK